MKQVRLSRAAVKDMRRHGKMADRALAAIKEYAADGIAHRNNVRQLVGEPAKRMRIGDYRLIFEESATEIVVTGFAPRGSAYD